MKRQYKWAVLWLAMASWLVAAVAAGALVSYPYRSAEVLPKGTLVSKNLVDSSTVEPATTTNSDGVLGVVVDRDDASVEIGDPAPGDVLVVHDGEVPLLVHDLAGPIAAGDSLSVSPLAGVAMRATTETRIVAIAAETFDTGSQLATTTAQIQKEDGSTVEVRVGLIRVQFEVGASSQNERKSSLPPFIQSIGDTISGRPSSPGRIIGALLAMLISLVISSVMIYGAVRSALISIGRNPLSRKGVYRGMLRVAALTLLVIGVGIVTMYVILRV